MIQDNRRQQAVPVNNQQVNPRIQNTQSQTAGGHSSKEKEAISGGIKSEQIREVSQELEIAKEVKEAGVEKLEGQIDLPPDLKKLGVTQTQSQSMQPITNDDDDEEVNLPIPDQKVLEGIHSDVMDSFHWMAIWCIRKLQKAHLALRVVGGKVIRRKVNIKK